MKKYLYWILGATLALLLTQGVLFHLQMGVVTEQSRWIHEAYELKSRRSSEIDGSKLMVVGGSGVLFSVSARKLEDALGVECVNYGTHAGLGTDYLVYRALPAVNQGDIVILCFEYNSFSYNGENSATRSDFLSARDPDYILSDFDLYMSGYFYFSHRELASRVLKRWKPDQEVQGLFFDVRNLNRWGDKQNIDADSASEISREVLARSTPVKLKFNPDSIGVKSLDALVARCHSVGAEVVLTFPATLGFEVYSGAEFVRESQSIKAHYQNLGVDVVGEPSDFFYPIDLFFDTSYHANSLGRQINTDRLGKLLKSHFDAKNKG